MKHLPSRSCLANRHGAALAFAMLTVPVMIGLAGLGIESGMARVQQSRIKNALDASAIAGIQLARQDGMLSTDAGHLAERLGAFNLTINGVASGRVVMAFQTSNAGAGGQGIVSAIATIEDVHHRGLLGRLVPAIDWTLGAPRSVATRPPIDICLVVDMGPSEPNVEKGELKITYIKRWINGFADRLDPNIDRIGIVTYSVESSIIRPVTFFPDRADLDASIEALMEYRERTRSDTIITGQQRTNLAEGIATARWAMNQAQDGRADEDRSRYMVIMASGNPDMIRGDFVNPRTVNPGIEPRWYPWNIVDRNDLIFPESPFVARPIFYGGADPGNLWKMWTKPDPDDLRSKWSMLKLTKPSTKRPPYYNDSTPRRVYSIRDRGYNMFETTEFLAFKGVTLMTSNCSPDYLTDPSKPDKNTYVSSGATKYQALRTTSGTDAQGNFLPPNGTGEHDAPLIKTLDLYDQSVTIPGDFFSSTGLGTSAAGYRIAPKDSVDCLDNMGLRDSEGDIHFDLWGEIPVGQQSEIDNRFEADEVAWRPVRGMDGSVQKLEVLQLPPMHRHMGFETYPALWDIQALNYYLPIVESDHAKAVDGDNITLFTIYMERWTYNLSQGTDIGCRDSGTTWSDSTPFCTSTGTGTGGYHNLYCKIANDPMILKQSGNPRHIFKDVYRYSSAVTDTRLLNPASNFRQDQTKGRFVYTVKQTEGLISEFGEQIKVRLVE